MKIVYTLSRGAFSIFLTWTDLGSEKHVTRAEVEDALKVCKEAEDTYGCAIASIPTDNAAKLVAQEVTHHLSGTVLPSRDPSHCLDLLSKDLANTDVVRHVMEDADLVTDFCKTDRIDSIKQEMMTKGELEFSVKVVTMSKTRMNLVNDYLVNANKQRNFTLLVQRNQKYHEYYHERPLSKREELNLMFEWFHERSMWERFEMLTSNLTTHFKAAQKICSRADFPLSVYVLLVQALKNDLCCGLNDEFDEVLGFGSKREVMDMIEDRFNMDGIAPGGRKVGLLDRMHLYGYLVDPYSYKWRSTFKLETDMPGLINEMIETYIPLDEDGGSTARQRVKKEFMVSTVHTVFYDIRMTSTTKSHCIFSGFLYTAGGFHKQF